MAAAAAETPPPAQFASLSTAIKRAYWQAHLAPTGEVEWEDFARPRGEPGAAPRGLVRFAEDGRGARPHVWLRALWTSLAPPRAWW